MGQSTKKLEVWAFHAHLPDNQDVDYRRLFLALRQMPTDQRQVRSRDRLVALPTVRVLKSSEVVIRAYEGPPDVRPLIYDTEHGTERLADTTRTEIVATKTHARLDLRSREAIIEYNHRGAKARDIADVVVASLRGHPQWRGLTFEFAPQVDRGFIDELDLFERIQSARVQLTQPNADWTDMETDLTSLAAKSHAGSGEVELKARRGGSLSSAQGIIPAIRRIAQAPRSIIQNATVKGRRAGEDAETRLSLSEHTAHQRVRVTTDTSGQVDDDEIEKHIQKYSRARRDTSA